MAEPIGFPEVNTEWIGPGDVGPLPTLSGDGFMLSCWILTPEEIEHVQRTGQVWLTVWGDIHPPVNIQAEYPFGGVEEEKGPLDPSVSTQSMEEI